MKTTTKILLGILGFFVLLIISSATFVKLKVGSDFKNNSSGNSMFNWNDNKTDFDDTSSANMRGETRQIADFNKIEVSSGIEIFYTQGNLSPLRIKANNKIIANIKTTVEDKTLKIYHERSKNFKSKVIIYVSSTQLNDISLSAGCVFNSVNQLKADNLTLSASAGVVLNFDGVLNKMNADFSAGCVSNLKGTCTDFNCDASAGSIINAADFIVKNLTLDASSGCIATVNVTDNLNVDASAGCEIGYKGNPKKRNVNLSVGATVNPV